VDADALAAGTKVQVETVDGCFRGTLIRPLERDSDVEIRCAGHYVRLDRRCIRRVRALNGGPPQR
jgi:tRNA U55 pseudouridine synthase TruB